MHGNCIGAGNKEVWIIGNQSKAVLSYLYSGLLVTGCLQVIVSLRCACGKAMALARS
jgi:hypothetical protein